MSVPGTSEHPIRSHRLDEKVITSILDELDEAEKDDRQADRFSYRASSVVVRMQQPGSTSMTPYLVPTRTISENRLSFLHGGFVHQGTLCDIQLFTTFGTWEDIDGIVVRCNYVSQSVHEVEVQFERPIDPSNFTFSAVHARVLLVDDCASAVKLAKFHLDKLNADVEQVETGQAVLDAVAKKTFDLLLIEMLITGTDGFETTQALRKQGYVGRIVALTSLSSPEDQQRCLDAGCDQYISKPYTLEDLAELLKSTKEEPLVSRFHDDSSMAELIETFVSELPQQLRTMEEALVSEDMKRLEEYTRHIKSQGGSYGFDLITDEAKRVETMIRDGDDFAPIRAAVGSLIRTCRSIRSSNPTQTA